MKTVLIVEDEKLIRQGLVAMVRRAPIRVEQVLDARGGEQALDILRSQPVDVMITDIRMPGMDGIELVSRTRTLPRPPLCVVVSGYDDFNYAVEMMRSGVKDYLLKPVEREKLCEVLQKLEEELRHADSEEENDRQSRKRALRYLMLSDDMPDAERAQIEARYRASFPVAPYRVALAAEAAALPTLEALTAAQGVTAYLIDAEAPLPAGVRGGVSAVHTGIESLHAAYGEALLAARRAFFDDASALRVFGSFVPSDASVSEKELQKIVQLLGVSRRQEAYDALAALFALVKQDRLSPSAMGDACEQLTVLLLSAYRTLLDPNEQEMEAVAKLWRAGSAERYLARVKDWMETFCERLLHEFDDYRNKQKIRDAVLYLHEHYGKPLNMAVVSNEVNMNYSLFSLLFKQYVGMNFVSYVQSLRIAEAKRLLRETDLRVNEIGRRVGFSDDKNFLKVFKNESGVSPTEFRRASQFE